MRLNHIEQRLAGALRKERTITRNTRRASGRSHAVKPIKSTSIRHRYEH